MVGTLIAFLNYAVRIQYIPHIPASKNKTTEVFIKWLEVHNYNHGK